MKNRSKLLVVTLIIVGLFSAGAISAVSVVPQLEHAQDTPSEIESTTNEEPTEDISGNTIETASDESIQSAINGTVTIYIERDGELSSQGSGFIYKDEYMITNHHVVSSNGKEVYESRTIYIKYADDSWTKAEIVGSDRYTDVAVLDPERVPDFSKKLTLDNNVPDQSERVYALGAPLGYSDSLTSGVVSATGRSMRTANNFTIPDTIQTDTEIDSGNSGGPLVLAKDPTNVVGVNRAKQGTAIGFAISSRMTERVATSIIDNGEFDHTYVGISASSLTPITPGYEDVSIQNGIVIAGIVEGSPSDGKLEPANNEDGLEDIIVKLEGQPVSDLEDLSQYLTLNKNVGDEVEMTVYNDGETRQVTIELAERREFISE